MPCHQRVPHSSHAYPTINVAGNYDVYEWHGLPTGAASNVPCAITGSGGTVSKVIDQTQGGGAWSLLGTYAFDAGGPAQVVITNQANGRVTADAFKRVRQP